MIHQQLPLTFRWIAELRKGSAEAVQLDHETQMHSYNQSKQTQQINYSSVTFSISDLYQLIFGLGLASFHALSSRMASISLKSISS